MNKKSIYAPACLLCALVFSGCASIWFTGPRGSADRSMPAAGTVLQTGTVAYIENKQGIFVRQSVEEQQQYPQAAGEMIVQGSIVREKFDFAVFFKEFLDSENSKGYEWNGFIRTTDFEAPAFLSFVAARKKATPDEQEQPQKTYIMEAGSAGELTMQLTDPYGDDFLARAPYEAASFALPDGRTFRLYAAKESAWSAHGRDADNPAAVEAQYPKTPTRKLYTLEDQLFQITDDAGTVIADLQGSLYTIYDTAPADAIDGVQSFIALFYTWQCIIAEQETDVGL